MKVTDEMVERACDAYVKSAKSEGFGVGVLSPMMRRALEAVVDDGSVPKESRWEPFTDEEVLTLMAAVGDRMNDHTLPEKIRDGFKTAYEGLFAELKRRRGGYQGPGVYEHLSGQEYEALGMISVIGHSTVILRLPGSPDLMAEILREFNEGGRVDERPVPRYRYLRPLERS